MPFRTLPQGDPMVLEARRLPEPMVLETTRNLPEPLVVAILDKPREREGRTTAALVYGFIYDHPASGAGILVPEGFVSDFASIPAAARFAFLPFGRHAKAAVLHDWLYAVGEPGRRWFADQVFDDAMAELEVDPGMRRTMYQAVHLFGQPAYASAARDWARSWADWRSGELVPLPRPRSDHFSSTWPRPPSPDYRPRT